MTKGSVETIYIQYKIQIDTITEMMDNNYKKAATIISWLYGGSSERWRHILSAQKKSKPPKEVEEFLKKFRKPKKK